MVSAAVACLPAAVSLLLLEALFMQISWVSLALTWPRRLCLLWFLLCRSLCYRLSPFQALGKVTLHLRCQACVFIYSSCGRLVFPPLLWSFPPTATFTSFPSPAGRCCCSCQPPCLFTAHVGSGSSLLSCGVFLPLPLSQASQLLVAWHVPLLPPEPLRPARLVYLQFIYSPGKGSLPPSSALRVPHPLSCVSLLLLLLITQFLFFPWVEVSLSRGLCCSGPGLSVGEPRYREAHLVRVFPSCLGASDWRPWGPPCFSV
jgi:hypothetical protein